MEALNVKDMVKDYHLAQAISDLARSSFVIKIRINQKATQSLDE
jgi:hypothetical protein